MASLESTFHLPVLSEPVQEFVTGAAFDGSFNTACKIRLTTKMSNLTAIYPDPRGASYYDSSRDERRLPPTYEKLDVTNFIASSNRQFQMLRFYPNKTKVIFFDLEYYVPLCDRDRSTPGGMTFSPMLAGHKILGGYFLTYYPMQDRIGKRHEFWEWNEGSESNLLARIFELLEREWHSIEVKDQAGSLMLAGIGISHSDVPVLLARLIANETSHSARIFDILFGCRQIDLSTATYCQFSFNQSYFAYPKTKSALYQKYLEGKKLESGKSVWDLYENNCFNEIAARCRSEVNDALAIYKQMFDLKKKNDRSLERLKKLEKANAISEAGANDV